MLHLPTIFLIFLQISALTWTKADKSEPYCDRNKTEVSHKMVPKTRIITVNKKGFFNKLSLKKETKIEEYLEEEPVYKIKLERACCDGYKMSDLNLCEPQCIENGCPQHSKCVEPEVCECTKGYFSARSPHDNKHYCEALCEKACPEHSSCVAPNECACKKGYRLNEDQHCKPYCPSGCPHNGNCLAPNVCECQEGYKSEHGSCTPICTLGDGCQNGKCVDTNMCECHFGYILNDISHTCEPNLAKFKENQNKDPSSSTINYAEIDGYMTESVDQPHSSLEVETDIDTSSQDDDIDPNEVFDEVIDTTTYSSTDNDSPTANSHKCPDDYVYHQGQCKPLKFASFEIDCSFKPCNDPHATCLDNGTCSCTQGFKWFRSYQKADLQNPINAVCLSLADYEARILHEDDPETSKVQDTSSWAYIFFIVLGVLIILIALAFLGWKLLWADRGELDVEAKNLSCAYDNRVCLESEKSVI